MRGVFETPLWRSAIRSEVASLRHVDILPGTELMMCTVVNHSDHGIDWDEFHSSLRTHFIQSSAAERMLDGRLPSR